MKKRAELLQKINALRKNVMNALKDGKIDEAKTMTDELDAVMNEFENLPKEPERTVKVMDKNMLKRVVNEYLHKGLRGMSEEAKQVLKPLNATDTPGNVESVSTRGGVLVPVETADFVGRMDTGVYRLRTRVDQYFAKTLSGNIPLAANPNAGLVSLFDELPAGGISKGEVTFGNVAWQVKSYGLIVPVSNELLNDASADVMGVISEQFARAQVVTEDKMILAAIDASVTATNGTDWKAILKAVNEAAPVGGTDKVIITNTDGWNYLNTLEDDNGHPILTQALVDNPKSYFRGIEVIQLPNAILATDATNGAPFYCGSMKDAIYFIERQGMEISYNPYSDSAYSKNAVDVRVVCRLDCKTKFANAVKKVNIALS